MVNAVTDADFESTVLKSDRPVLVDFWATWCAPCRMIAPVVEELAGEMGDKVRFVKMDVDQNPRIPGGLGIMSIPTLIMFKDGQAKERVVGFRPGLKGDLKGRLERLL